MSWHNAFLGLPLSSNCEFFTPSPRNTCVSTLHCLRNIWFYFKIVCNTSPSFSTCEDTWKRKMCEINVRKVCYLLGKLVFEFMREEDEKIKRALHLFNTDLYNIVGLMMDCFLFSFLFSSDQNWFLSFVDILLPWQLLYPKCNLTTEIKSGLQISGDLTSL